MDTKTLRIGQVIKAKASRFGSRVVECEVRSIAANSVRVNYTDGPRSGACMILAKNIVEAA